ncbi:hypothetical protein PN36_28965 [Candidatus Thiomargarita nelsonii]|uniref:Uncharacterized protein n=1 Tax=Candidatus Thiomargarita nelsonii TaxID=1003181 RepID=A0A4E0QLI1_9GAMM|nr:hypothetical protein PN36_28965 [Candidatus Thiomargarita nelsonii]
MKTKKIDLDMSPEAIGLRLKTVSELRRATLTLAKSDVARAIRKKNPNNPISKRVALALGEISPGEEVESKI